MTRIIAVLLLSAGLAGCAAELSSPLRSEQSQARLQQLLAGRVAGPAVSCLSPSQRREMITIDDNTILFRSGGTIYRNDPAGGCSGLRSGYYALVTRSPSTNLCSGDIARVADVRSGMTVGNCAMGDFVPYAAPGR